jgi:hypothetical protein
MLYAFPPLGAGRLFLLLENMAHICVSPYMSVHTCYFLTFQIFQSMILRSKPLSLDDQREGVGNSTHCLSEGVSV